MLKLVNEFSRSKDTNREEVKGDSDSDVKLRKLHKKKKAYQQQLTELAEQIQVKKISGFNVDEELGSKYKMVEKKLKKVVEEQGKLQESS